MLLETCCNCSRSGKWIGPKQMPVTILRYQGAHWGMVAQLLSGCSPIGFHLEPQLSRFGPLEWRTWYKSVINGTRWDRILLKVVEIGDLAFPSSSKYQAKHPIWWIVQRRTQEGSKWSLFAQLGVDFQEAVRQIQDWPWKTPDLVLWQIWRACRALQLRARCLKHNVKELTMPRSRQTRPMPTALIQATSDFKIQQMNIAQQISTARFKVLLLLINPPLIHQMSELSPKYAARGIWPIRNSSWAIQRPMTPHHPKWWASILQHHPPLPSSISSILISPTPTTSSTIKAYQIQTLMQVSDKLYIHMYIKLDY